MCSSRPPLICHGKQLGLAYLHAHLHRRADLKGALTSCTAVACSSSGAVLARGGAWWMWINLMWGSPGVLCFHFICGTLSQRLAFG